MGSYEDGRAGANGACIAAADVAVAGVLFFAILCNLREQGVW